MKPTTPSPESEKLSVDERIKLVPTSFLHRMSATLRNITATLFCRSQIRVVCILLVGTAVAAGCYAYPYWKAGRCVRTIALQPFSFSENEPVVIRSNDELRKFAQSQQPRFDRERRLEDAINSATVDFDSETLILVCLLGPDNRDVGHSMPYIREKRLRCTFWRGNRIRGFDEWTFHCFALIVRNDSVDDLDIRFQGDSDKLISLDRPHPN